TAKETINRLKLAELQQDCLGIKQDLIHRLQAYLEEHAEEEANEDDVLGDETEEEETKPIELPVKEEEPPEKSVDVAAEKKNAERAEGFNVPVSLESKKVAQAARFGISSVPTKGLSSDYKPMVNLDKAQRFGLNVSSISRKSEDDEKLKKRKERFGIVTSSAGTGTTEDTEAKKRKRAERFGIAWCKALVTVCPPVFSISLILLGRIYT
uniref:SAP domain-containing protein n=1 Tax=Saimiri boliviensis boliviensis TaxID=39432 RepID=A0A2K6TVD2_SAIBB